MTEHLPLQKAGQLILLIRLLTAAALPQADHAFHLPPDQQGPAGLGQHLCRPQRQGLLRFFLGILPGHSDDRDPGQGGFPADLLQKFIPARFLGGQIQQHQIDAAMRLPQQRKALPAILRPGHLVFFLQAQAQQFCVDGAFLHQK